MAKEENKDAAVDETAKQAKRILLVDDEPGTEAGIPTGIPRPPALSPHPDCQVEPLRAQAKGSGEISVW